MSLIAGKKDDFKVKIEAREDNQTQLIWVCVPKNFRKETY